MRLKLLALIVGISLGAVAAQEKPEQYPGQKDHAEPPKGWFCSGAPATPADHKCACANMPKDDKDPICAVYGERGRSAVQRVLP